MATAVATVAIAVSTVVTAIATAVSQVFIPSVAVEYTSTHHADILCALGPMMDEVQWKAKGLDNYGLIAVNSDGNAAQVTIKTFMILYLVLVSSTGLSATTRTVLVINVNTQAVLIFSDRVIRFITATNRQVYFQVVCPRSMGVYSAKGFDHVLVRIICT